MMRRWGTKALESLIEGYETHACLYNKADPFYLNRRARKMALQRISERLKIYGNFSIEEINSKIKSIRTTYSRSLRQGNQTDPSQHSNVWYLEKVKFLENHLGSNRKSRFFQNKNLRKGKPLTKGLKTCAVPPREPPKTEDKIGVSVKPKAEPNIPLVSNKKQTMEAPLRKYEIMGMPFEEFYESIAIAFHFMAELEPKLNEHRKLNTIPRVKEEFQLISKTLPFVTLKPVAQEKNGVTRKGISPPEETLPEIKQNN